MKADRFSVHCRLRSVAKRPSVVIPVSCCGNSFVFLGVRCAVSSLEQASFINLTREAFRDSIRLESTESIVVPAERTSKRTSKTSNGTMNHGEGQLPRRNATPTNMLFARMVLIHHLFVLTIQLDAQSIRDFTASYPLLLLNSTSKTP
jgi:hypothetical protein